MAIDHRALLKKYIAHVGMCEGVTFISHIHEHSDSVQFTDEELVEINAIEDGDLNERYLDPHWRVVKREGGAVDLWCKCDPPNTAHFPESQFGDKSQINEVLRLVHRNLADAKVSGRVGLSRNGKVTLEVRDRIRPLSDTDAAVLKIAPVS